MLIIERMFEVHGETMDLIIMFVFLKEWCSEEMLFEISYSEGNHEIS